MNKERRANIQKVIDMLNQHKSATEKIASNIQSLLVLEEQHRDSIPVKPQYQHLIDKADFLCDYIGAASEYVEEVKTYIDYVINALKRAME